jgi:hypothetical protein
VSEAEDIGQEAYPAVAARRPRERSGANPNLRREDDGIFTGCPRIEPLLEARKGL